jgi:hypothetical protein
LSRFHIPPRRIDRSVSDREIEKARPLQVGLFASFDNAAGQRHFARGPTLKTAQATGCGGSIAELRAVLQSLTQTFSNSGEPSRPQSGVAFLAFPPEKHLTHQVNVCHWAVNNQFRVRWWTRQKDWWTVTKSATEFLQP